MEEDPIKGVLAYICIKIGPTIFRNHSDGCGGDIHEIRHFLTTLCETKEEEISTLQECIEKDRRIFADTHNQERIKKISRELVKRGRLESSDIARMM